MNKRKKLPKGWRWASLIEPGVVDVDPKTDPPKDWDDKRPVSFLPMALVDETTGMVTDFEQPSLASCRKGKRRFRNSDVLFAKITPCVQNGKIAYVETLPDPIGFGSTEFYVLRAGASILPEYLWFFLRTSNVVEAVVVSFTGTSGRQRVPSTFWDNLKIPLPPLAVQERIVEVLQQADAIRRKRAEARRLADQILPALFLDMFGDPNESSLTAPLDSCAFIRRGISKRPNPQGNTPIIRIKSLRLKGLMYEEPVLVLADEDDIGRGRLEDGDIVMSPLNGSIDHVGKSDMFATPDERPWLLDSNLCAIRAKPKKAVPLWLTTWLKLPSTRERLRNMAVKTSGGQWLINSSVLAQMEVPLPSYAAQEEFLDRYNLGQAMYEKSSAMMGDSKSLLSVALSHAFTGELTAEWEAANADWIAERQAFYERLPRLALLALLLERCERAGRNAETLITALMKYAFLAQMEGELRRQLYRFVPYHYGPCAMELYDDLKALEADGLLAVQNDAEEDKTRITLSDPDRADGLLEEEAKKDDAYLAALEQSEEEDNAETDPAMPRLLRRRAEIIETLRSDATAILETYGDLDHKRLLKTVYEKYPAYAKKSRLRKTTAKNSGKKSIRRGNRRK